VVVVTLDEMWHFVKKTEKLWLWRAYDPIARRTIAWVLGRRDDAACKHLLNKIGVEGKTFVTDDWEGYHRPIPESQLFTGKDLTVPIEQDNSNIRHFLARFRRRTKVVSKAVEMVDLSLRIYHHFHDDLDAFATKAAVFSLSLVRTLGPPSSQPIRMRSYLAPTYPYHDLIFSFGYHIKASDAYETP
jgi:insertion element IS1 protein InsB